MANLEHIRNFCIIAHIDHGKSTLADRLIEITGTMQKREIKDRVMDTLELEQERGITIKLQTARLEWEYSPPLLGEGGLRSENEVDRVGSHKPDGPPPNPLLEGGGKPTVSNNYILNLIDTPGHVDFSYEVSRSVAASEGALLIVDASQGIQAQTLTTIYKAMEYDLTIIPVLNKIDLPNANVERVKEEVIDTFGFAEEEMILASGKTGKGVENILNAIVERIKPPDKNNSLIYLPTLDSTDKADQEMPKALIFDSFFHEYMGVISLVKVVSGEISKKDELHLLGTNEDISPVEIGYLTPALTKTERIVEGEVGYIATGLKDIHKVHTGDTIVKQQSSYENITALMGYEAPKPMVYASLYPVEASDFSDFQEALEKLSLNDAALSYQKEYSQALGTGFVCGFLGLLHLEITQDRLEREFGINLISTTPSVEYQVHLTTVNYDKLPQINVANIDEETNIAKVRTAAEFPEGSFFDEVKEPWIKLEIVTPEEYIGDIMELTQKARGVYLDTRYINKGGKVNSTNGNNRHAILIYEVPTAEIIVNYFDKLKSVTHGYASMDYSFLEYRKADVVKVSVLVNGEPVEPLSFLCHRDFARNRGKKVAEKLKELIPRQQFKVPIQAAIGGDIIARETIQAFRKDVTAKLYGGDVTRKMKLLEKQKKGKKKLKQFGSVEIPKEAFLGALKSS